MVVIQKDANIMPARQNSRQHWLPCEPAVCGAEAFDERDMLPSFERGQSPHGSWILRGTKQDLP